MPNWVKTKLTIKNVTDEEFRNIVEQYCTKNEDDVWCLDFEKLIPMPDNVFRGPLSTEDRKKYPGNLNWYDWSCNHWGTKWNACHGWVDFVRHVIGYETAWSYADPPVMKLAVRTEAGIEAIAMNEDISCGAEWYDYDTNEGGVIVNSGVDEYGTEAFWDAAAELWDISREEEEGE